MGEAYYNEIDPFAAAWLRELIAAGHIAPGIVDERDIRDVRPDELARFTQCHFFAGIGVWSYALRRAGWSDDTPIWTGSCPCQPFSQAGKGDGFADERHVWPAFHWLIEQCGPLIVAGEQVAAKDADPWFDLVQSDLEALDYAFGCVPLAAAGFGAPNIRERGFWVAYASMLGHAGRDIIARLQNGWSRSRTEALRYGNHGRLADAHDERLEGRGRMPQRADQFALGSFGMVGRLGNPHCEPERRELGEEGATPCGNGAQVERDFGKRVRAVDGRAVQIGGLGNTDRDRQSSWLPSAEATGHGISADAASRLRDGRPLHTNGFWRDAEWLLCRDPDGPRWRPVEPGTFPLAHGTSQSMGLIRGSGNAINAEAAAGFLEAVIDHITSSDRLAA